MKAARSVVEETVQNLLTSQDARSPHSNLDLLRIVQPYVQQLSYGRLCSALPPMKLSWRNLFMPKLNAGSRRADHFRNHRRADLGDTALALAPCQNSRTAGAAGASRLLARIEQLIDEVCFNADVRFRRALQCRVWVTGGCRDSVSATDGLPPAADAPLQRSELAKSARSRHSWVDTSRSWPPGPNWPPHQGRRFETTDSNF